MAERGGLTTINFRLSICGGGKLRTISAVDSKDPYPTSQDNKVVRRSTLHRQCNSKMSKIQWRSYTGAHWGSGPTITSVAPPSTFCFMTCIV